MRFIPILFLLAACEEATTREGCPIYVTEMMQAYTAACQQAYYEDQARQSGGTVTRCFPGSGGVTCISE